MTQIEIQTLSSMLIYILFMSFSYYLVRCHTRMFVFGYSLIFTAYGAVEIYIVNDNSIILGILSFILSLPIVFIGFVCIAYLFAHSDNRW